MKVKLWFRDPRMAGVRSDDSLLTVELPTIPMPRETIVFTLYDHSRGPDKAEIHVHMKVRRRIWMVRQNPETGAGEIEAQVFCVDRLEDE